MNLKQRFVNWCESQALRMPDKVINKLDGSPYLVRWHVIPRNRFFNIYFHHFVASDEDRALHDHPWLFNLSILVNGNYKEVTPQGIQLRLEGEWKFRWGKAPHRVWLFQGLKSELPCRTIFITGPVVREWGFYCPRGWVHWKIFTNLSPDGKVSNISKGCDE